MIKKITYGEINFEKYQICLQNSVQQNFYANRIILDQLCERWELLVYKDYDFVMPVPLKKKYGFFFVIMPLFCQQLGVSGPEKNIVVEEGFLQFLLKNYNVAFYSFHHTNSFKTPLPVKKNYWIEKTDFALLRKNYFKGRKSTVKSAQNLIFRRGYLEENLNFISQHFKGLDKKKDRANFISYLHFLNKNKLLNLCGAYHGEILTSLAVIIQSEKEIFLLGLVNDEKYRSINGASFLIDRLLQKNVSVKSFDFMGGNIRGIEIFFKSFGSTVQEYSIIQNSKKDLVKNLFLK